MTELRSSTRLLAAEGEKLAGQRGGSLRGVFDLKQFPSHSAVRLHPGKQNLGVTNYYRKQIVEVVRDAARKISDRFHLLRLAKLVFDPLALGDVADRA